MATEPKGAYNISPIFTGENYGYWKACTRIHVNFVDKGVWDVIINGPNEITMANGEGVTIPKLESQWNNTDRKLWSHYWKAQNILISGLGVDEYYHVSHYETAKEMWDTLEVSHEGTNEVKQARINTLNQEFELFHMKHGETITDMQKRSTHLINRLNALGNPISNDIATNMVLRCLNREWKPKVTAIKEANDLTTLFGKLEEHEKELTCLEKHKKEYEKKMKKDKGRDKEEVKKSIALKISSLKSSKNVPSECEERDDKDSNDDDVGLFVKRY